MVQAENKLMHDFIKDLIAEVRAKQSVPMSSGTYDGSPSSVPNVVKVPTVTDQGFSRLQILFSYSYFVISMMVLRLHATMSTRALWILLLKPTLVRLIWTSLGMSSMTGIKFVV